MFDPVLPDADEARELAENELAKEAYQSQGEPLTRRIQEWVRDRINDLVDFFLSGSDGGLGAAATIVLIVLAAVVIAVIVWKFVGPIRRSRSRTKKRTHRVFDDDSRPARDIAAAAERAAKGGDWVLAVLESYRALIRSLEERDIIDDRPGITAHEAAVETAAAFPAVARDIVTAGDIFDDTRYGHRDATRADYEAVQAAERALRGKTALMAATR